MNQQQILERMLSFSLQQHGAKDKTIEELQKKIAELQKSMDGWNAAKSAEVPAQA
jgi:hypothetical protein